MSFSRYHPSYSERSVQFCWREVRINWAHHNNIINLRSWLSVFVERSRSKSADRSLARQLGRRVDHIAFFRLADTLFAPPGPTVRKLILSVLRLVSRCVKRSTKLLAEAIVQPCAKLRNNWPIPARMTGISILSSAKDSMLHFVTSGPAADAFHRLHLHHFFWDALPLLQKPIGQVHAAHFHTAKVADNWGGSFFFVSGLCPTVRRTACFSPRFW